MLTTRLRGVLLVMVTVGLVVLPGCGGGGSSADTDYKREADRIGLELRNAVQNANTRIQAATDTEGKLAGLAEMREAVEQAAEQFGKLNPPKDIKADNDMLVEQLRSFAADIQTVEQAARDEDEAALQAGVEKIQQDAESIQATIERIQGKLSD